MIGFDSVITKYRVVRATSLFKSNEVYIDIAIQQDMTPQQREQQRVLSVETKGMKKKQSSGNYVYRDEAHQEQREFEK